jgi:hypothetical protein
MNFKACVVAVAVCASAAGMASAEEAEAADRLGGAVAAVAPDAAFGRVHLPDAWWPPGYGGNAGSGWDWRERAVSHYGMRFEPAWPERRWRPGSRVRPYWYGLSNAIRNCPLCASKNCPLSRVS